MAAYPSNFKDQAGSIQTRNDLVAFLHELVHNLQSSPSEWENPTLESYLEALAAWVEDCEGFYANRGETVSPDSTWKTLSETLLAAKHYE